MKRFYDWPRRLEAQILASRNAKFEWGKSDCAMFAADAILAMTGVDLAADFRGKYSDEAGARGLFESAIAHASQVLPAIDLGFARRGDLVLTRNGSADPGLGIVGLDGRSALCASDRGFIHVPRVRWIRAWKVT